MRLDTQPALKPCPFCGRGAEMKGTPFSAWVLCMNEEGCHASGPWAQTAEEAARKWNNAERKPNAYYKQKG